MHSVHCHRHFSLISDNLAKKKKKKKKKTVFGMKISRHSVSCEFQNFQICFHKKLKVASAFLLPKRYDYIILFDLTVLKLLFLMIWRKKEQCLEWKLISIRFSANFKVSKFYFLPFLNFILICNIYKLHINTYQYILIYIIFINCIYIHSNIH